MSVPAWPHTVTRCAALLTLGLALAACGGDDSPALGSGAGMGGGGLGAPAPAPVASSLDPLSFQLRFQNNTRGVWPDDQIYVTIAGTNAGVDGQLTYVQPVAASAAGAVGRVNDHLTVAPNDTVARIQAATHSANDDPARCQRHNNTCYPILWFTLADLNQGTLVLPGDGKYYGTRIYLSYGQPMYMRVNQANNGLVQLDVGNPNDVNFNTINDFFEWTFDPYFVNAAGQAAPVTFGGNVTQVDGFAIPLDFTLEGDAGTQRTRGITLGPGSSSGVATRQALIERYLQEVSPAFQGLLQQAPDGTPLRVVAPYKNPDFQPGGKYFTYYDAYVNEIWAHYAQTALNWYDQGGNVGNRFTGQVLNDALRFTRYGTDGSVQGPYDLQKPNTFQLFTQNGPFANDAPQPLKDLFRDLSSAIHRHVALNTDQWHDVQAFYQGQPQHEYARFLHEVSLDGKAYAFGYDDAADQSPVIILPGGENPTRLTVRINH